MSRKFVLDREINFIQSVTKELVQKVVEEEVIYYAISLKQTQAHRLYNESVKKTWDPPVKANALVSWENSSTTTTNMGSDSKYGLEVYFHEQELNDRRLIPKEGDFIEYGQTFFEITSVTQPQIVFGQINNKVMTKCTCVPSREGQFAAGGDFLEGTDNTHPRKEYTAQEYYESQDGVISTPPDSEMPTAPSPRTVYGDLLVSGSLTAEGFFTIDGLDLVDGLDSLSDRMTAEESFSRTLSSSLIQLISSGSSSISELQSDFLSLDTSFFQTSSSFASLIDGLGHGLSSLSSSVYFFSGSIVSRVSMLDAEEKALSSSMSLFSSSISANVNGLKTSYQTLSSSVYAISGSVAADVNRLRVDEQNLSSSVYYFSGSIQARATANETNISNNSSLISAHTASKTTHGISGEVVGTTDVQVLSNKMISGSLTFTGSRPTNEAIRIQGGTYINLSVDYAVPSYIYYETQTGYIRTSRFIRPPIVLAGSGVPPEDPVYAIETGNFYVYANGRIVRLRGESTGSAGNATLNAFCGKSMIAAGSSQIAVSSSLCKSTSIILANIHQASADATLTRIDRVYPENGKLTIYGNAPATNNVIVAWIIND